MKPSSVRQNIDESLQRQRKYHGGRRQQLFNVDDDVMIRDYRDVNHPTWVRAKIVEVLGQREYICQTHYGKIIRRHLDQNIAFAEFKDIPSTSAIENPNEDGDAHSRSTIPDASEPTTSATTEPKKAKATKSNSNKLPRREHPNRQSRAVVRHQ